MKILVSPLLIAISLLFLSCGNPKQNSANSDSTSKVESKNSESLIGKHTVDSIQLLNDDEFDYELANKIESYIVNDVADTSNITTISKPCAVYVFPDGEILEAMRKKYGEDYFTIADDANWYMSESSQTLDSTNVYIAPVETRFIKFTNKSGKDLFVDTKASTGLYWNLFFFHPEKKPKVVSMAGLSKDSVKAYFNIR